jgi:hypothetical protein
MPQPEDPPKEAAKKERYKYGTDQLMNQFLKMESGGLGRSPEYRRGHVWNFEWCSEDPAKAQPEKVRLVNLLMSEHSMPFDEAFDRVLNSVNGKGDPCPKCANEIYQVGILDAFHCTNHHCDWQK